MSEPTLLARGARIAVDGVTAVDGLTFTSRGPRVLLTGDTDALMAALVGAPMATNEPSGAGTARVVGGQLRLGGRDVGTGEHFAVAGAAAFDPPLPATWTVREHLTWAARLSGVSARRARAMADAILAGSPLTAQGRRPLGGMTRAERRAVGLLAAAVGEPEVLALDRPLDGLPARETTMVLAVLGHVSQGRAAVISTSRLDLHGPSAELARGATDICVLRGGELALHAEPGALFSDGCLYEVTLTRNGEALRDLLREEGLELAGGPQHYALSLPADRSVTDLLAVAIRADAPVLSCVPVFGVPSPR